MQQALKNHFGQSLPVTLVNHPPPPTQALLAQLVLLTQFVLAAVVLSGPQAAPYLARIGIVLPPETWQAVQEKKVGILMGAWFIGAHLPLPAATAAAALVQLTQLDAGREAFTGRPRRPDELALGASMPPAVELLPSACPCYTPRCRQHGPPKPAGDGRL